ncbi:putative hemagglutinin/hemolysin-related protein [Planoprotostelium fungivorum]|uniref:Putative hemagglutinin/hemolysin-related protein n=1 Tax=Planoprotostelium fungivorum TaxID=1890364 RepID=A0A2P6NY38_9EUKA|nr:putative hemagglutinin/hemolysin-related protein [Planoprotostelium fungivorum]
MCQGVYVLTHRFRLISRRGPLTLTPAAIPQLSNTIQGLSSGETLLSNYKNVYRININTAQATKTSTLNCDLIHSNPTLALEFEPTSGQLNIVTLLAEKSSNHFVADVFSGQCQTLPSLAYDASSTLTTPSAASVAFYNGKFYVIDAIPNSVLSTISGDKLVSVGSLGHEFSGVSSNGRFFGLAALYQPAASAFWAINLASGAAFKAADSANLRTNLIGFTVLENGVGDSIFPTGALGSSASATPTLTATATGQTGATNTNTNTNTATDTNGNGGSGNFGTTSFTSAINPSESHVDSTVIGTVFPVGSSLTQSVSYTETVAAFDYNGASKSAEATVVVPSGNNANPIAAITETVIVGQGTDTAVEVAGISWNNGRTETTVIQDGTATRAGVVVVDGAQTITVGQLTNVEPGQTFATAEITLGDGQGRTSNAVGSFVLTPSTLGRDQNSGSAVGLTASALLVAAVALFTL